MHDEWLIKYSVKFKLLYIGEKSKQWVKTACESLTAQAIELHITVLNIILCLRLW